MVEDFLLLPFPQEGVKASDTLEALQGGGEYVVADD